MLNKDFPCRCGHAQKLHNFNGDWLFQCAGLVRTNGSICPCQVFRPDNLAFIEKLSGGGLTEE